MSQVKLFTFNASSFPLDPSVESFLKSKGALSLDFGTFAYVNSEAMPAVLSELVEKNKTDAHSSADLVAQLKAEVGRHGVERQKAMEDNTRQASQIQSHSAEAVALKEQAASAARMIEILKAENALLPAALKNTTAAPAAQAVQGDDKLRQPYEKLQKEFQALRAQSAEALTSLKVLEEENEELTQELDHLRNQLKNAAAPKAGPAP